MATSSLQTRKDGATDNLVVLNILTANKTSFNRVHASDITSDMIDAAAATITTLDVGTLTASGVVSSQTSFSIVGPTGTVLGALNNPTQGGAELFLTTEAKTATTYLVAGTLNLNNGSGNQESSLSSTGLVFTNPTDNINLQINAGTVTTFNIFNDGAGTSLPAYDSDAAAGVAGLTTGDLWQSTGGGTPNFAGAVMIKQ